MKYERNGQLVKWVLILGSEIGGFSGLSGNRDKNVPTIVVNASQTADRRDIPVPNPGGQNLKTLLL